MTVPERLEDAPTSAKFVYHVLHHSDDALSLGSLRRTTKLPESTLRYALDELETRDAITRDVHPSDSRSILVDTAE